MWKHTDELTVPTVFLHDCVISHMETRQDSLLLHFDNGFWVAPSDDRNPYPSPVRTDRSEVEFLRLDGDLSRVFLFRKRRFLPGVKRLCVPLEDLIEHVNSGKWRLELIGEYIGRSCQKCILQGYILQKRRPYSMDCQLELSCENAEFHWNDLNGDAAW